MTLQSRVRVAKSRVKTHARNPFGNVGGESYGRRNRLPHLARKPLPASQSLRSIHPDQLVRTAASIRRASRLNSFERATSAFFPSHPATGSISNPESYTIGFHDPKLTSLKPYVPKEGPPCPRARVRQRRPERPQCPVPEWKGRYRRQPGRSVAAKSLPGGQHEIIARSRQRAVNRRSDLPQHLLPLSPMHTGLAIRPRLEQCIRVVACIAHRRRLGRSFCC